MKNSVAFFTTTLFAFACLVGCGERTNSEQEGFANQIKQFQMDYKEAEGNDIAQDNACKAFDEYVKGHPVNNWGATVVEVNSFLGSRWIVADADGISYKVWPENDAKWSDLGEDILGRLKVGDEISFSGTVNHEMSFTCSGKMSEPEIQVDPNSVSIQ